MCCLIMWQHLEGVENEKNYLIKSVINHSINLRNRRKKVSYGEVWLPEPVATELADTNMNRRILSVLAADPAGTAESKRKGCVYPEGRFRLFSPEISEVLPGTVELSRKLLSRAKSKLGQSKHPVKLYREPVPSEILEKYEYHQEEIQND